MVVLAETVANSHENYFVDKSTSLKLQTGQNSPSV